MSIPLNFGFRRMTDAMLDLTSSGIISAMTTNATVFPAPHPELTAATAAQTAFATALAEAQSGGDVAVATKKQKRIELIEALIALGSYVIITAAGDPVVYAASNFPARKTNASSPPLGAAEIKSLKRMDASGSLLVTAANTVSARWFVFEYTQNPDGPWTAKATTKSKLLLTDLEAGKVYFFRVTACGINDQVSVSAISQLMVY